MELAVTRLKTLLGSEDEWREKLLALEPYLEQYPNPRSVEELDEEKARLETAVQELREQEGLLQQQFDKLRQQELDESQEPLCCRVWGYCHPCSSSQRGGTGAEKRYQGIVGCLMGTKSCRGR